MTSNITIPNISYASAPAIEVLDLGGGKAITQEQALSHIAELNKTAAEGSIWRLESPHEMFALRSQLKHTNANGAHSHDESIKPGWYWTSEETPWFEGGRVVVGFGDGDVLYGNASYRAFARAVRVVGQ